MKDLIVNKLFYIVEELKEICESETIDKRTQILNLEHRLGEFHAYFVCLKYIDFEKAIEIIEESKEIREKALHIISKIYNLKVEK
jgi:hypothetical protein